jgi:predicted RNase H-like HicB family nuclease/predicted RNA binding protein YcfA (HicA-like mRNA interferase family)
VQPRYAVLQVSSTGLIRERAITFSYSDTIQVGVAARRSPGTIGANYLSRRRKMIERMKSAPGDIRFVQVTALLRYEGFVLFNKRGSHRTYHHRDGRLLTIVVPHDKRKTCHPEDIRRLLEITPTMTATHHEYRGYVFTLTYQPQEPAYTADFQDFPSIITSGATLAEAFAHACEALDLHLESVQKLGKRVPRPRHMLVVQPV